MDDRSWVPLCIIACVLLAAPASAQLPAGADPITIEAPTDIVQASIDEPAELTITVTRPSQTQGSPLDDILSPIASGDVMVAAGGVPQGWTLAIEPSGFPLAPGESQEVRVRLLVAPGAEDAGTITLRATLSSPDPSGLLAPNGEASHSFEVERSDSATRQLLEAVGPGIWAVLGALLAALIVALFLAIGSRASPAHLTGGSEVDVAPGKTVSVPAAIENRSKDTQRFALQATVGDIEWTADLPVDAVELKSGETQDLHVAIHAAKGVPVGSRAIVRVVAVPEQTPRRVDVLQFAAHVVPAK